MIIIIIKKNQAKHNNFFLIFLIQKNNKYHRIVGILNFFNAMGHLNNKICNIRLLRLCICIFNNYGFN